MATLAELQDALVNADKAGDAAAAKQLADAIVETRKVEGAKPAAVQAGQAVNSIPRQLGLTARYALEGPAQAAEIVTEPIRRGITDPLLRMLTGGPNVTGLVTGQQPAQSRPLGKVASDLADWIGLPSPQGANERVIGDATKMLAGGGGMAGAARGAAGATSGVTQQVMAALAAAPGQQAVSAAGAGLLGGASREAGADPLMQAGASLLGGVAAPSLMNGAMGALGAIGRGARNMVPNPKLDQQVEQTISLTLQRQGVDWAQVPERVKQGMREEVKQAMSTGGDLNPAAMRRLLDFKQVPGTTPTQGALTLDPVQITREKNLAKTGANSTDVGLQGLAQLENRNNNALIGALNDAGARNAPDSFATGQKVIDALQMQIERAKGSIGDLYSQARDSAGRSAPLDGASFTQRASQMLDEGLLGGALPSSVESHLNRIAKGEVPFTVDYAEQLKTAMGKLQRATNDGQTRMALGVVRQALDDTPLRAAPQVNPGNLPAVAGSVPESPAVLGADAISAFNKARNANRQFMQTVESTPALKAVYDGVEPDKFVQQFITGTGATVKDVQALRAAVGSNKEAYDAVRANIADHLKRQALNGAADEVGNFSQSAYNKALQNIGARKLEAFFTPQEIAQLEAVGRVASYTQFQPRGSAVNNSNSGALVLGRGLDLLDKLASKLPLGLENTVTGVIRGVQQREALKAAPGLLLPQAPQPMGQRLIPPLLYGGGLLAAPSVPQQ